MDGTLCLGGGVTAACPTGAEYEGCPRLWNLNHVSAGSENPVADANGLDSNSVANLTMVPCTQNFETQAPQEVTVQFLAMNEFEQQLSASTSFQCWASFSLDGEEASTSNLYGGISTAFERDTIGTDLVKTTVRAVGNQGIMLVLEEQYTTSAGGASSAQNVHSSFEDVSGTDIITIPGEQIQIVEP